MTTPPEAVIGDLVPLLYRTHWIRFGMVGEIQTRTADAGSGAWEERGRLEVAPGGWYRAELTDGEGDRELLVGDGADGTAPFPDLMSPSWLLPDFDLQITGRTEFLGRAAIAITGSSRLAGLRRDERINGLVDAELGIFLRYQRVSPANTESAEFTRLTVSRPEYADREQDRWSPPSSRSSDHESPAQEKPVFSDAEVNLLYRSDLGPQRFSAQLSEQTDAETIMRLSQEAIAATNFGSRTRWLWQPFDDVFQNVDSIARLTVAMPGCYLIEAITDPRRKPAQIACNGQRLWRAYPDRVAVRAAEPLPPEIATIIDPAWLLEKWHQVSVLGEAVVDGRPALHVRSAGGWLPLQSAPLSGIPIPADQVEAFIDRTLGICLRQVCSWQGHTVLHTELTSLATEVDQALFDFVPPPGMKVISGGLLAETGLSPASLALSTARGAADLALEIGRRWLIRNNPAEPGR
jgi:hypothetical protein